jgi:hypothetical protein
MRSTRKPPRRQKTTGLGAAQRAAARRKRQVETAPLPQLQEVKPEAASIPRPVAWQNVTMQDLPRRVPPTPVATGTFEPPFPLHAVSAGNQGETSVTKPLESASATGGVGGAGVSVAATSGVGGAGVSVTYSLDSAKATAEAGDLGVDAVTSLKRAKATGGSRTNSGAPWNTSPWNTSPWTTEAGVNTVTLAITPAQRRDLQEQLGGISTLLEQIAAELEASRRERGLGDNAGPSLLAIEDVRLGVDAANVFRTELSAERPRLAVIRLCQAALRVLVEKITSSLPDLKNGFVIGTGSVLANQLWHHAHDVVTKVESLLHQVQSLL